MSLKEKVKVVKVYKEKPLIEVVKWEDVDLAVKELKKNIKDEIKLAEEFNKVKWNKEDKYYVTALEVCLNFIDEVFE